MMCRRLRITRNNSLRLSYARALIFVFLMSTAFPDSAEAAQIVAKPWSLFDQIRAPWTWFVDKISDPWFWFGMCAQGLFFARFFVQWIASERLKRSVVPVSFWYISVLGACSLFVYACKRDDLVIMLGAVLSCVIYLRNLRLIHNRAKALRLAGLPPDDLASTTLPNRTADN